MAVTTLEDVEATLVRPLTLEEQAAASRLVELVEAEVLGHLPGYDLGPASTETVAVTGSYEQLKLPRYPVTAVTAVSVNGAALAASTWSVTPKGYLTLPAEFPSGNGPDGSWTPVVTVTYTHGQPAAGSPLVLLVAEAVASHLQAAGSQGLRSMSLGDYSEAYESRRPVGLVDRARLNPYRRSGIGSILLSNL